MVKYQFEMALEEYVTTKNIFPHYSFELPANQHSRFGPFFQFYPTSCPICEIEKQGWIGYAGWKKDNVG